MSIVDAIGLAAYALGAVLCYRVCVEPPAPQPPAASVFAALIWPLPVGLAVVVGLYDVLRRRR